MNPPTGKAKYIDRGGELVFQPPFIAENVQLDGFVLRANSTAIQTKICDVYFNNPMGKQNVFKPVLGFVALIFGNIERLRSTNPLYEDRGWTSELEAAFWVLLHDTERNRLLWFHPYMWVNNHYAMAMGRELYGFPKAMGASIIPAARSGARSYSLSTLVQELQTARNAVNDARLLGVDVNTAFVAEHVDYGPREQDNFVRGLISKLPNEWGHSLFQPDNIIDDIIGGKVPFVFLKQMRDVVDPTGACHQSVVEVGVKMARFQSGHISLADTSVNIASVASHPIARDFGFGPGPLHPIFSFQATFDFVIGAGQEVWSADSPQPGVVAQPATPAATPAPPLKRAAAPEAAPAQKKIAILGGGMASLTTAMELSRAADWKTRYDITVYQVGWRLGGKGASGRGEMGRIEEHGLHLWFGFYHNAFSLMREAYTELGRPNGAALQTIGDAFKRHSYAVVTENIGGQWRPWGLHIPEDPDVNVMPGDVITPRTTWYYIVSMLGWMRQHASTHPPATLSLLDVGAGDPLLILAENELNIGQAGPAVSSLQRYLRAAHMTAQSLDAAEAQNATAVHGRILALLDSALALFRLQPENLFTVDDTLRRLFIICDLGAACVRAVLRHPLLLVQQLNLDLFDEQDFRAWLADNGAAHDSCWSAPIKAIYDLVFGYDNGTVPSLSAGVALNGVLRMLLDYRGAIMWKMQAGMGDVVFAPIYEVLKKRGVKFEFFHRVQDIQLSADKNSVAAIKLDVQATPRAGSYDPLLDINDLPCWPSKPLYAQLNEGQQLESGNVDLESHWTSWKGKELTLTAGKDFDDVVLGISIAALPFLTTELVRCASDADPTVAKSGRRWQDMLRGIRTVRTQAMQLWLKPTLADCGWRDDTPALAAYVDPLNTWVDMTHLLPRESWPAAHQPKSLAYLCGPDAGEVPQSASEAYPAEQLRTMKANAIRWLNDNIRTLWPATVDPATGAFNYGVLADPEERAGTERLEAQYFRVNVNPAERYVLSLPGTLQYRLQPGRSGFSNLYLAGDWTRTDLNAGCIEAAAQSGIAAARAIALPSEVMLLSTPDRILSLSLR